MHCLLSCETNEALCEQQDATLDQFGKAPTGDTCEWLRAGQATVLASLELNTLFEREKALVWAVYKKGTLEREMVHKMIGNLGSCRPSAA